MTVSEAGTLCSFSATSTILNDSDEPDDSAGPQNPMEILRGSMRLPRYLSAYFVERKYLNMPYPEFRDELPMTEEQVLVFKEFHRKHIAIRDHLEQYTLEVQVLIPKRVVQGGGCGNCPIHVRFHGGGFVSCKHLRDLDIAIDKSSAQDQQHSSRGFLFTFATLHSNTILSS